MGVLRFVVYDALDLNGTANGEATTVWGKRITVEHDGDGGGELMNNRNIGTGTAYVLGDFIRCFITDTFATELPARSAAVGGFFIEGGTDVILDENEQGGRIRSRSGRGPMSILDRAILWHEASGTISATVDDEKEGKWTWPAGTSVGTIALDAINDADARGVWDTYGIAIGLDFDASVDSNGDDWETIDEEFSLPIGMNVYTVLGLLRGQGAVWVMDTEFELHGYQGWTGPDKTATVTFEEGVNVIESAERDTFGQQVKSWMLVQGATKAGNLRFREVEDAGLEASDIGRREGFLTYGATPSNAALTRAGRNAISVLRKRHQGPGQIGVLPDPVPFTDYFPGDRVTLDLVSFLDTITDQVDAITLVALEQAETSDDPDTTPAEGITDGYNVVLGFDGPPYDQLDAMNDLPTDTSGPGGGGGGGNGGAHTCGDCPPSVPFVPDEGDNPAFVQGYCHYAEAGVGGEPVDVYVELPSAPVPGHIIVAWAAAFDGTDMETAFDTSNWTVLGSVAPTNTGGEAQFRGIMAYRIAQGGDDGFYNLTTGGVSGCSYRAAAVEMQGLTTPPVAVTYENQGPSSTASLTVTDQGGATFVGVLLDWVNSFTGDGDYTTQCEGLVSSAANISPRNIFQYGFDQGTATIGIGEGGTKWGGIIASFPTGTSGTPGEAQVVHEEDVTVTVGSGITSGEVGDSHGYIPGSLHVWVQGRAVNPANIVEDDPVAGEWHITWQIASYETVDVEYQRGYD